MADLMAREEAKMASRNKLRNKPSLLRERRVRHLRSRVTWGVSP